MDLSKFAKYIKHARLDKKMTQKELARELGVDVSTVSKWERGLNYPDIEMLPKIKRCLDVSIEAIFNNSLSDSFVNNKKNKSDREENKNMYNCYEDVIVGKKYEKGLAFRYTVSIPTVEAEYALCIGHDSRSEAEEIAMFKLA